MTCASSEQLIMQALDGALTTRERASLDAHLAGCAACRQAWTEYAFLAQTADAWARETQIDRQDEDFTDRVWARVTARSDASLSRRRLGWTLTGAFAIIGASVAIGALIPLPIAAPDVREAFSFLSTIRAGLDISPWLTESSSAMTQSFDASARIISHGYALPTWVPGVMVATMVLNLALFARVRRQAAS